jgi:hypothetical protein
MNLYKKYIFKFLTILLIFVAFNFITYKLAVEELISNKKYFTGDIARLDYMQGYETYRPKYDFNLTKKHLEAYEIVDNLKSNKPLNIDILTIGDSFFHGGGYGLNPYFQDYLASDGNLTVLDIPKLRPYDNFETIIGLLDDGFFEKIRPKYFIVGAQYGGLMEIYNKENIKDVKIDLNEYIDYIDKKHYIQTHPTYSFINSGNIMYYIKWFDRNFQTSLVEKKSYQIELDRNLFSLPHNNMLVYYKEFYDFKYPDKEYNEIVNKMDNNFKYIAKRLKEHNIKLIILPIPTKLTLYNKYIENDTKKLEQHNFIQQLLKRNNSKLYSIANIEQVLANEISKGEKDMWYSDDTHWSYKASKVTSDYILEDFIK